jgi:hypothetical protein
MTPEDVSHIKNNPATSYSGHACFMYRPPKDWTSVNGDRNCMRCRSRGVRGRSGVRLLDTLESIVPIAQDWALSLTRSPFVVSVSPSGCGVRT